MEEKTITVKDVIGMTINDLRSINVPADLLEVFGPPISRALSNLKICYKKIDEEEKKQDQKDNEPHIEIVEEEPQNEEEDQLEGTIQE